MIKLFSSELEKNLFNCSVILRVTLLCLWNTNYIRDFCNQLQGRNRVHISVFSRTCSEMALVWCLCGCLFAS